MDSRQFDDLARSLGAGSSRRRLLKGLGAGIAAAVAAGGRGMGPASVSAKGRSPCCPRDEGYTAVCPKAGGHACIDTTSDVNNCGSCGNSCSTGQICQGGVCTGGSPCSNDTDCDDNNACTIDTCEAGGSCSHVRVQAGTTCADATCSGTVRTVWACNGVGLCNSTAIDCVAYRCLDGNTCYTSCVGDAQCALDHSCRDGVCRPAGWCQSDADCPPPPNSCQVATCDNNQCGEVNAPAGTTCASATCSGTVRTEWACDGAGVCGSTPTDCVAYRCLDGNTCYTSCSDDTPCAPGYTCNAGLCVALSCGNGICDAGESCTTCPADCGACPDCIAGITEACYTGPLATRNVGTCRDGTRTCQSGGTWGPCVGEVLPATELCDALDNDCDGLVDEGFNLETDVNNCGGCGQICSYPHATPACVSRVCQIASCDFGFTDCDGQTANGCETNTATDPRNCGSCGNVCPSGESCVGGICGRVCSTAADCNDGNLCTNDTCGPDGVCVNAIVPNGTSCAPCGTCQAGVCVPSSPTVTCGSATGPCDLPATCDGSSLTCPPNKFRSSSYVCRAAVNSCDIPETCTGTTAACPQDARQTACYRCTFPDQTQGYCWNGQCTDLASCPPSPPA